jgi:hypothetical protein
MCSITGLCLLLLGVVDPFPQDPVPPDPDAYSIHSRSFKIPLQVDPARADDISQITLFVSSDRGQTWQEVETVRPGKEFFRFVAPGEGPYWFTTQVVTKVGLRDPEDVSKPSSILKVMVDTRPPPKVVAKPSPSRPDDSDLRARVERLEKRLAELEERQKGKP